MGRLGSRLLFLEMPNDEQSAAQLVADVAGGDSYKDRVERCAEVVAEFLDALWRETGRVRGVAWDRAADPEPLMLRLAGYAKALARVRGTISVWREGSGDDESYNFSTPIIEQPHRAMSQLYALARGHALVHGRRQLTNDDLPIVVRAALESTPNDRRAVIRILLANGGTAATGDVEKALRCSAPTARAILETLNKIGVGAFENPGAPTPASLRLADSLHWLLDDEAVAALKKKRRREGKPHGSTDSDKSRLCDDCVTPERCAEEHDCREVARRASEHEPAQAPGGRVTVQADLAAEYRDGWECPCGAEPPKRGSNVAPVRTLVSLREPRCPFCGRAYKDEYRVSPEEPPAEA
jgi:hypothetical protein